jgi:hypothetical protein
MTEISWPTARGFSKAGPYPRIESILTVAQHGAFEQGLFASVDLRSASMRRTVATTLQLPGAIGSPTGWMTFVVCEPPDCRWSSIVDFDELQAAKHIALATIRHFLIIFM